MKRLTQVVSMILVLAMIMVVPVSAKEISPYASNYFTAHSTYFSEDSSTSFKVWFSITAVGTMQKLGVNYIDIERSSDGANWGVVKTYEKSDYNYLVASNTFSHSGSVTYSNRQSGYQYRAYVEYYAKNASGSATYGVYIYL